MLRNVSSWENDRSGHRLVAADQDILLSRQRSIAGRRKEFVERSTQEKSKKFRAGHEPITSSIKIFSLDTTRHTPSRLNPGASHDFRFSLFTRLFSVTGATQYQQSFSRLQCLMATVLEFRSYLFRSDLANAMIFAAPANLADLPRTIFQRHIGLGEKPERSCKPKQKFAHR